MSPVGQRSGLLVGERLEGLIALNVEAALLATGDAAPAGQYLVGATVVTCFTDDARSWWPDERLPASGLARALAVTSVLLVLAGAVAVWDAQQSLGVKGLILIGAGTLLGVVAVSGTDPYRSERVVAGSGIYYLRLAQFDPWAPLQGDYVALAYQLPQAVRDRLRDWPAGSIPVLTARGTAGHELEIVGLLDPDGTVHLLGLADDDRGRLP